MFFMTLDVQHLAGVPRHQGRVIKLLYCGEGPIQKTLMLVGKVGLALLGHIQGDSLVLQETYLCCLLIYRLLINFPLVMVILYFGLLFQLIIIITNNSNNSV